MSATKSPITDQVVQDCVVQSVQGVFRTMLGHEVAFVSQAAPGQTRSTGGASSMIIASVGFLGDANGLLYLCLSEEFAKMACAKLLGMSAGEIEMHGNEVLHDAIGELTNMTVGGFKNALCDLGFPCKLTLPAIVRGHKLSIASISSASRHIFQFDCLGHGLVADLQLKLD